MFEQENTKEEDAAITFQRGIYNILHLKLPIKCIFPVYDYFHTLYNKTHYVFYAEVPKMQKYTYAEHTLAWFTFKQIIKLPFTKQTKQDIIVAHRVIDAQEREIAHTQYHAPAVPSL